jgi:phosphoribosylglycinamide formyltransferase-1
VVLISGKGSNLQAIIDATHESDYPAQVVAVISNRPDAYGLQRARAADISTEILEADGFPNRNSYDQALMQLIDTYQPDLVVLAGFMRILSDDFVHHYAGRMLNIHPSLLPKYKGLNTHQRVLEAGDKQHGASVHLVTPSLDDGPVILQSSIEVLPEDTAESLAQRIHQIEHQIYPQAIRWFAEGRLRIENNHVYLDDKLINTAGT